MRLLVAGREWFPEQYGGLARFTSEMTRRLAERDHDLRVLLAKAGNPSRQESLAIERYARPTIVPDAAAELYAGITRGRRWQNERFDLVLAHSVTLGAGLAVSGVSGPLGLIYHAPIDLELRFDRSRLPLGRQRFASFALSGALSVVDGFACMRATRVFTLSKYVRSLILDRHPELSSRVRVVSGAVDTRRFSPGGGLLAARSRLGLDPRTSILLAVRRLEPRMGIENLIAAVAKIRQTVPNLVLVVIGDGSLRGRLERLVRERSLASSVWLLGNVEDVKLVEWYRAATLSVLPTIEYEGFGLATVESLACGTPVVGTAVGATPEILSVLDRRLIASGPDPDSVASAIESVLALDLDPLRAASRAYACSRFEWDYVIRLWENELLEAACVDSS